MGNNQSTNSNDLPENSTSIVESTVARTTREKFGPLTNIKDRLKPGDILEFHRGMYCHYALCIGNGKVMNINAEDKKDTSALICEKLLEEVCGNSKVRMRNHDDIAWKFLQRKPRSVDSILSEAFRYAGRRLPYEFAFRNCEYYSTYWRFGKGFSTQVAQNQAIPLMACPSPGMGVFGHIQDATESLVMKKYAEFSEPAII